MSISGPASAFDSETFGQDASFHLEQPIGSMTISPSGRDVALASKDGLHIIDLDSPYSPPRYLAHRTPWEVADVQWSPFASRDYWVVSTSNQKALVWNLGAKSWQDTIELVLHGHTRAITDINFSAHNPDSLATCAVDSFVHCWDLRSPARPAISFSDWFAGATQVKWSRQDENVVASSHDRSLHIWDVRHGAHPVRTIEAHSTKIYGIDWNRFEPHKIVTCSLDKTIKFWNSRKPEDEPDRVIETPFPVWRARHTPFGWGLVAMPQRGSSELYLYDRREIDGKYESGHVKPVAKFAGHNGQVKEFLWRARGNIAEGVDNRDFQLISWGTDRELRLHRLNPEALEGIGYEKGVSKTHRLNFTRRGARYRTFRDLPDDSNTPIERTSRSESLPSQYQMLNFRNRRSTTVGMSKLHVSQVRGWAASKDKSTRNAMHGKASNNNDVNPIAWLKNVKIASWDPDALAEEIRQVGEKFKKVDFETVDIKHRKVVIALQAPWTEHQHAIYLRVDIRFPQSYPRGANAVITIQKTGNMEDELFDTLSAELHTIAEVYSSQQRGCLEAVLRYLLREQSLEQIVTWAMGETLSESKIFGPEPPPVDDSSDSDDDHVEGIGTTLASNANVRVPLAKGCGALWAECGKLVCFFPPKPKETDAVFGGLSVHDFNKNESSKLFGGLGHLIMSPPSRKGTNGAKTIGSESDSDSNDSLLDSSSSSSSSSGPMNDLPGGILPDHKFMPVFQHRSKSIDFSNRSTTMAGAGTGDKARKTVLSLHSFPELQPSSKTLAEEYQIAGPGDEACEHNAQAARNAGRSELESVWTLAGMILSKTVPLEVIRNPADQAKDDILVIARQAVSKLGHKNSSDDMLKNGKKNGLRAQLKWGNSPLATVYLVAAMFDYFDRVGDVQMLGMLACIFARSLSLHGSAQSTFIAVSGQAPKSIQNDGYYPSSRVAKSILRPDPETSGFAWVERLPTLPMSRTLSTSGDNTAVHSRRATTVSFDPSGQYKIEPGSRRWSRAPSVSAEDGHSLLTTPIAVSLSTSPEGNRMMHRAATSLSHAQASLSALTQSYSHSPPAHSSSSGMGPNIKKHSPSASLTPSWNIFSGGHGSRTSRASMHQSESSSHDKETSLRSSMSYSNVRSLRRDGHVTPDTSRRSVRSLVPSEGSDNPKRVSSNEKRKKRIKTSLRNQNQHDLEGHVSLPLLDPKLESKYRSWRAAYAAQLEVWQLSVQRAEVLKVNGQVEEESDGLSPIKRPRRKTLTFDSYGEDDGLRIRRTCRSCGSTLAAIEKNGIAIGWHCVSSSCLSRARKTATRTTCTICCKAVTGLSIPCLNCGHITCYECAKEWFGSTPSTSHNQKRERRSSSKSTLPSVKEEEDSATEDDTETDSNPTCPTGCGCSCSTMNPTQIHVPYPTTTTETDTSSLADTAATATPTLRPHAPTRGVTTISHLSNATSLLSSAGGHDTALASFFGLTKSKTQPVLKADPSPPKEVEERERERLLNPFASAKFSGFGKGIGGGLSRGLSTGGSAGGGAREGGGGNRERAESRGSRGSGSTVRRMTES